MEVLRVGLVLEVVDRQHDRSTSYQRNGPSPVMHHVRRSCPAGEPRVLGDDAPPAVVAVDSRDDHRVPLREFRVRIGKRREAVDRRPEAVGLFGEAEQLAHEILLRPTDVAGDAPEQVHRHLGRRLRFEPHRASSR